MSNGVRRVVTGNDAHGRSVIVTDGAAANVKQSPQRPGVVINNLWMTDSMPAKTAGDDAGARLTKLEPAESGTNFRIVEFPPERAYIGMVSEAAARQAFDEMGGGHAIVGSKDASGGAKPRHPFMHRTKTLDYAIVLTGEVVLVLDDSEVTMQAGDVCIQRATNHAWSNRSDRPCRIAFVLIDGDGPAGH